MCFWKLIKELNYKNAVVLSVLEKCSITVLEFKATLNIQHNVR